jgi:adenylosuccinate synthase
VPSGILHPGKRNVIGSGVAVDPLALLEEIEGLRARACASTARTCASRPART